MLSGRPTVTYRTMAVVETLKKVSLLNICKANPEALAEGVIKAFVSYGETSSRR
jgi:hypothetical protein